MKIGDLYMPDTPEGRAIEQCARAISTGGEPGQLAMVRRLARIAMVAMVTLVGPDAACGFFAGLSRDCLRNRAPGAKRL